MTASGARRVLLLAPETMPQAVEWRRVLADCAGSCVLATMHPAGNGEARSSDVVHLGRGWATPWTLVFRVRRLFAREAFDFAIAYYLTSYGFLASLAVPSRYVAVAAGSDIFPGSLRRIRGRLASRTLRRAAGAVAWTERMARRMLDLGADRERLLVRPRGIDLGLFRPIPGEPNPVPGRIRVISTRRLRPIFRHDRLVRAVAALVRSGHDVTLELLGDGSERPALERIAIEEGIPDRVSLPGDASRRRIVERLRRSDVFVSLSRSDGLSTSLVEAMACGTVPVVSDIEANRDVVAHGENGLLVDAEDPDVIARAILRAGTDARFAAGVRERNAAIISETYDIVKNTSRILEAAEDFRATGSER